MVVGKALKHLGNINARMDYYVKFPLNEIHPNLAY